MRELQWLEVKGRVDGRRSDAVRMIRETTRAGSTRKIGPKAADKLAHILTCEDPSAQISELPDDDCK